MRSTLRRPLTAAFSALVLISVGTGARPAGANAGVEAPRLTALVGGAQRTEAKPGEAVTLPVTLDLSEVSPRGELGAVQFDLRYDPSLLVFASATPGVRGSAMVNLVAPGRVRFAFAATEPQGSPRLTLLTVRFRVAEDARSGAEQSFDLEYAGPIGSTTMKLFPAPSTRAGSLRVAAQ